MPLKCVSVVIPIYNVVKFLDGAIKSVLSDAYPDIEIVVVNDGSNAEATTQVTAICNTYPQVTLIHQPNMGQAPARRTGVQHARGEYIIFLDADDILLPGAVSYLAEHMDAHPDAVGVYGKKIRMEEDGSFIPETLMPYPDHVASGDVLPALLWGALLFSHGNICVRRKFLETLDFPENLRQGEDWVTWCRLALLGDIIYVGDRTLLALRNHTQNVSSEVLKKPSELLKMINVVFNDEAIIQRIGTRRLAAYRNRHLHQIHSYLRHCYIDRKQPIRAMKQAFILRRLPRVNEKIRILHVVKWFYAGGAERIMTSVLAHSDSDKFEHIVLSLSDQGERIGDIQHNLGIPYKSFEMTHGKFDYATHRECFQFVRDTNPDLIKTWLPPANITGGIMAKLIRKPLIWGIHSDHSQNHAKPYPKDVRLQTKLSHFLPNAVICCGQPSYDTCELFGYNPKNLNLIINGTDTEVFSPQPEGRKLVREELGVDDDTILIGMAAECRPHKRQAHFLIAARQLLLSHPNVQFVLCGIDNTLENAELMQRITFLDLEKHVHLLGIRNDMANIYSALDIHTLNPLFEAFGLATTESMACETLCVATDVGIKREFLEDVGIVYPMEDNPSSLVEAWKQTIALDAAEKQRRARKGRQRIIDRYSIVKTAKAYDELFERIATQY